ncbi:MAG: hypothetical protein HWN67_10525 [Candidatus Helarchaeota archaeon]|nr:hypothetical protein [Candidatus Helarchaeota archaeon]
MSIVPCKIISVGEAREVRAKLIQDLEEILQNIADGIDDSRAELIRTNQEFHNIVQEIVNQLKNLRKAVKQALDGNLNSDELLKYIWAFFKIWGRIDEEERLKVALIEIETKAIIANSKIRWISDAESIIKDPSMALNEDLNFTFHGNRKQLAKEFQSRFFRFMGYDVAFMVTQKGFQMRLINDPPVEAKSGISPIQALKTMVEEFLRWELRKIGCPWRLWVMSDDSAKVIFCVFRLKE